MMYCVNCEAVTYDDKAAGKCQHCGNNPDIKTLGEPVEGVAGRILHLVEKIVDHTKEGGEEIAGWRMSAIRDAANAIEKELSK